MEDKETGDKVIFTGDTLFIGGCGRFFEGTGEEMHEALNVVLAGVGDDVRVYVSASSWVVLGVGANDGTART